MFTRLKTTSKMKHYTIILSRLGPNILHSTNSRQIILTAYGPLKKSTQNSDEYTFGHKCQIKKNVGHIMNNTYTVFYLCILNYSYNTPSLIVPVLEL